jgi:hypothetical protein
MRGFVDDLRERGFLDLAPRTRADDEGAAMHSERCREAGDEQHAGTGDGESGTVILHGKYPFLCHAPGRYRGAGALFWFRRGSEAPPRRDAFRSSRSRPRRTPLAPPQGASRSLPHRRQAGADGLVTANRATPNEP